MNHSQEIPEKIEDLRIEDEQNLDDSEKQSNEDSDKSFRYKEGDPISLVRVRFPGNAKSQAFLLGKRQFIYAQKVLAMSDRGMTVGYINSFPYDTKFKKEMLPLRTIAKYATNEDLIEHKAFLIKEKEAENICTKLIKNYKLDMNLTHVEYIQFGKKAVFYFTAPARVDFRDLVKELVGILKMRIELRQISVRDRAAAIGATGPCGLQTCCSSFLQRYGNASIKMAKNQNLALIPNKLNGVCGQIKCCIKYEDEVYSQKRRVLPKEGSFVQLRNGDRGRITRLHIILEQFEMITDRGNIRRYYQSEYDPKNATPPSDWKFPVTLSHVIDETSKIIGLTEKEEAKLEEYHNSLMSEEYEEINDSSEGPNEEEEEEDLTSYRYKENSSQQDDTFDDDKSGPNKNSGGPRNARASKNRPRKNSRNRNSRRSNTNRGAKE